MSEPLRCDSKITLVELDVEMPKEFAGVFEHCNDVQEKALDVGAWWPDEWVDAEEGVAPTIEFEPTEEWWRGSVGH